MTQSPYKVYVVVDRDFGERLAALPEGVPVWIVDTIANSTVAQRLWKERKIDHLTGVTTFSADSSSTGGELVLSQLDSIDLHHGPFSANPPYSQLEILGTPISPEIRTELSKYGFDLFETTPEGFRCSRSVTTYQV